MELDEQDTQLLDKLLSKEKTELSEEEQKRAVELETQARMNIMQVLTDEDFTMIRKVIPKEQPEAFYNGMLLGVLVAADMLYNVHRIQLGLQYLVPHEEITNISFLLAGIGIVLEDENDARAQLST